jgi:uncharacterized protein (TIGR02284 family)
MTDRTKALHTLLTRLLDSHAGYEDAIAHVDSPALKSTMTELMARRQRNASEVRSYLERAGETVDSDTSLLADAHRVFLGLKDAVTGSDDATILAEVVRGEKTLRDAYDEAITAAGGHDPEFDFLVEQHRSLDAVIGEMEQREQPAA